VVVVEEEEIMVVVVVVVVAEDQENMVVEEATVVAVAAGEALRVATFSKIETRNKTTKRHTSAGADKDTTAKTSGASMSWQQHKCSHCCGKASHGWCPIVAGWKIQTAYCQAFTKRRYHGKPWIGLVVQYSTPRAARSSMTYDTTYMCNINGTEPVGTLGRIDAERSKR
jgi:hypothetical protein